jgi:hypothetical protein
MQMAWTSRSSETQVVLEQLHFIRVAPLRDFQVGTFSVETSGRALERREGVLPGGSHRRQRAHVENQQMPKYIGHIVGRCSWQVAGFCEGVQGEGRGCEAREGGMRYRRGCQERKRLFKELTLRPRPGDLGGVGGNRVPTEGRACAKALRLKDLVLPAMVRAGGGRV